MKHSSISRLFIPILSMFMVFGLAACGGEKPADPNLGKYMAIYAELAGQPVNIADYFEDGSILELKAGGACVFSDGQDSAAGIWSLKDGAIEVEAEGFSASGTLKDGILVLNNLTEQGLDFTFMRLEDDTLTSPMPTVYGDTVPLEGATPAISPEAAKPSVPFEPVAGGVINAGNIRAICPEGWFSSPVTDYFAKNQTLDPDALLFLKGTDDSWASTPFVSIRFYGKDHVLMSYEEQKGKYDSATDIEPFFIGADIWEGITYHIDAKAIEAVVSVRGRGAYEVIIRLEGAGEAITFADADVQTILSSIEY